MKALSPYALPDIGSYWRTRGHSPDWIHGFRVHAIEQVRAFDIHTARVSVEVVVVLENVTDRRFPPANVYLDDFRKLFVEGAQA